MGKPDAVVVEDDCEDQAITKMPKCCLKWPCCAERKPLVKRGRFMCCPLCGDSYGQ